MPGWEELVSGTRVVTQVKATINLAEHADSHTRDRKEDYVLHRRVVGVDWVLSSLAAPLLVALDGAHICVLNDDLVERARETRIVRVIVARYLEAASTCVPRTKARHGTEGKLAHRGTEAVDGLATCCGGPVLSACALVERGS